MKRILGVTGGVGAGKSQVLDILKNEHGAHVILSDQVAKELMDPGREGYRRVVEYLGVGTLESTGAIDRPKMARMILGNQEALREVNRLTHPLVWEEILRRIEGSPLPLQIVETALPEKQFRDICDEIWYVYTSEENRARRLFVSRGYDREKTVQVMKNQLSDEEFRSICHRVIDNNGSIEDTREQISRFLSEQETEESTQ